MNTNKLLIVALATMVMTGCGNDRHDEIFDYSPAVDLTEVIQAHEWYTNNQGEDKDELLQTKLQPDLPDPEEATWLLSDTSFVLHVPQYAQSTHPFLCFAEDFYNSLVLGWNLWSNEEIWFHSVVGDEICSPQDVASSINGISIDFIHDADVRQAASRFKNFLVHYMNDDSEARMDNDSRLPYESLETFNNAIDKKLYKFYQNPELFSDSLDSIMRLVTGLTKEKAVKYADAEENDRLKVMLNELNACENFDEQCSLWCNWTNSLNSVDENVWILAVGKKLMDSGHYSPLINKIWFIFRALCQSEYFGMSRTSVIPSDYYNTYRQKCYKACLKRIEQHPDDKVAMACALSIAGRTNVIRFGENYFGNDAMIEAVMLMPGRYEYLNEGVDGEEEGLDEDSDETMEQIE